MEENTKKKVYVLELVGDIVNTGGSVTLETGGVSLDRSSLEVLREQKERELDEYFGVNEESDEDYHDWCYMNTDLSERPFWTIVEYDLV